MKKLLILAFAALGMLACTEPNNPDKPTTNKEGALGGKFSVSASTKVQFSQGNLQYQASTNTWRFAEIQYDIIGEANKNISASYSGWIDLFGWGTGNNPTLSRTYTYDLEHGDYDDAYYRDYGTFTDWGGYKISNGGNNASQWRTLTSNEWLYLFHSRSNAVHLFGFCTVNGISGVILLPDDWATPNGLTFSPSTLNWAWDDWEYCSDKDFYANHFLDNTYTSSEWSKMETAGAVFFPAAGCREFGTDLRGGGYYWSSTPDDDGDARYLDFGANFLSPEYPSPRSVGMSVRLVKDVQ